MHVCSASVFLCGRFCHGQCMPHISGRVSGRWRAVSEVQQLGALDRQDATLRLASTQAAAWQSRLHSFGLCRSVLENGAAGATLLRSLSNSGVHPQYCAIWAFRRHLLTLRMFCLRVQRLVQQTLASFMLQDLRRYSMFESQAIRPYTISAMSCWQRAVRLGYIHMDTDGKVSSHGCMRCPRWQAVLKVELPQLESAELPGEHVCHPGLVSSLQSAAQSIRSQAHGHLHR